MIGTGDSGSGHAIFGIEGLKWKVVSLKMPELELDQIQSMTEKFGLHARLDLDLRLNLWPVDFSRNEVHEVIGALLARQVTLAVQLASIPVVWNGHTAPLVLRAMADVYISIAWILKDPLIRSQKFVL